jgi:hypothetical protein
VQRPESATDCCCRSACSRPQPQVAGTASSQRFQLAVSRATRRYGRAQLAGANTYSCSRPQAGAGDGQLYCVSSASTRSIACLILISSAGRTAVGSARSSRPFSSPAVIEQIFAHLGSQTRAPPRTSAREHQTAHAAGSRLDGLRLSVQSTQHLGTMARAAPWVCSGGQTSLGSAGSPEEGPAH